MTPYQSSEIPMSSLSGKTLFISGASRGIGLAIALRAARDGANVVIAAKSNVPNPKLPGTLYSAAAAVEVTSSTARPMKRTRVSGTSTRSASRATARPALVSARPTLVSVRRGPGATCA